MARTFKISLSSPNGAAIVLGTITAEEIPEPQTPAPPPPTGNAASPRKSGPDERMTDPQKRYLFRLLAAQGVDGKQVEEHLKGYFKVSSLREVSKAAAHEYIDQLLADRTDVHGA